MKIIVTLFTISIMVCLILALIFGGISVSKVDDLPCRRDSNAENLKNNATTSTILIAIALGLLFLLIIYVLLLEYRRNKINSAVLARSFDVAETPKNASDFVFQ